MFCWEIFVRVVYLLVVQFDITADGIRSNNITNRVIFWKSLNIHTLSQPQPHMLTFNLIILNILLQLLL